MCSAPLPLWAPPPTPTSTAPPPPWWRSFGSSPWAWGRGSSIPWRPFSADSLWRGSSLSAHGPARRPARTWPEERRRFPRPIRWRKLLTARRAPTTTGRKTTPPTCACPRARTAGGSCFSATRRSTCPTKGICTCPWAQKMPLSSSSFTEITT